ncbi:hypothetical protein OUQ99_12005 [Streptomonospora nanhaiensis]|uniref:Bacteriocin n=1 Tax=Streptomonospora nanhaiensis TaxID=1323731 RepID=A0ABY6YU06_9ACTN|nr:hypothetical protein [Streptomonospora nanhaiensis]WAE75745.1 hypothetical protein OUQ99_12005 [Streptomonospora nanhaiensis]
MTKERRLLPGGSFEAYVRDNDEFRNAHMSLVGNTSMVVGAVGGGAVGGVLSASGGASFGGYVAGKQGCFVGWVGGVIACRN